MMVQTLLGFFFFDCLFVYFLLGCDSADVLTTPDSPSRLGEWLLISILLRMPILHRPGDSNRQHVGASDCLLNLAAKRSHQKQRIG